MSLNIKNERVHALAREAARRTGQTQTGAIESALRAYLAGLVNEVEARDAEAERRYAAAAAVLEEMHEVMTDEDREAMKQVMDEMYDENGLPA